MFERVYRQRLEADLARWQAEGIITPAAGAAIRNTLPPLGESLNVAAVVAIAGGLLIAAAFLAFVASNWTAIPRVLRLVVLLTGIAVAHGAGAGFARTGRPVMADLCASVGSIIFGAGIALVGQMYHLGDDFAAGMLLWAAGALAASALTGSRGALAVALAAGVLWSYQRLDEGVEPHLPFVLFWLLSAGLPLAWNSRAASHLVAVAALWWWVMAAVAPNKVNILMVADGAALLLGAGLLLEHLRPGPLRTFGAPLAAYGAFALAAMAALAAAMAGSRHVADADPAAWVIVCGLAGVILAAAAALLAAAGRRRAAGPVFSGIAIALVLAVANGWLQPAGSEPWLAFVLELVGMLCLVVSGMLDETRPRIVAGWIGLAAVIASITWAVRGSLLARSVFLAAAGAAAVAIATLLGRWLPQENRS